MSQRQVAKALGISQPAVSQQLTSSSVLTQVHPELLQEAGDSLMMTIEQAEADLEA